MAFTNNARFGVSLRDCHIINIRRAFLVGANLAEAVTIEFRELYLHVFPEEPAAQVVANAVDDGENGVKRSDDHDIQTDDALRVEADRAGGVVVTANVRLIQGVARHYQIFGEWHTPSMSSQDIVQAASIHFANQTISAQTRRILAALELLTESSGTSSTASTSLRVCARRLEDEAAYLVRTLESLGRDSSTHRRIAARASQHSDRHAYGRRRSRSPERAAAAAQRSYERRRRSRSSERDGSLSA